MIMYQFCISVHQLLSVSISLMKKEMTKRYRDDKKENGHTGWHVVIPLLIVNYVVRV